MQQPTGEEPAGEEPAEDEELQVRAEYTLYFKSQTFLLNSCHDMHCFRPFFYGVFTINLPCSFICEFFSRPS